MLLLVVGSARSGSVEVSLDLLVPMIVQTLQLQCCFLLIVGDGLVMLLVVVVRMAHSLLPLLLVQTSSYASRRFSH